MGNNMMISNLNDNRTSSPLFKNAVHYIDQNCTKAMGNHIKKENFKSFFKELCVNKY